MGSSPSKPKTHASAEEAPKQAHPMASLLDPSAKVPLGVQTAMGGNTQTKRLGSVTDTRACQSAAALQAQQAEAALREIGL